MIYLIYGTDIEKARVKAHDLVASLQKKRPDASFFRIDSDNWSLGLVDEYSGGQGLFEKKHIILVDRVAQKKELREELADSAELMGGSENIFIIIEGKLDKPTLTKLSNHAEKIQEYSLPEDSKVKRWDNSNADRLSVFTLGDALGRKDRRELWSLYRQFMEEDLPPEEVHGVLFWQAKSMLLAQKCSSAAEAGLNPFVYSKSKAYAKNFSEKELHDLLTALIEVSHESRRGQHDLETALEALILKI